MVTRQRAENRLVRFKLTHYRDDSRVDDPLRVGFDRRFPLWPKTNPPNAWKKL